MNLPAQCAAAVLETVHTLCRNPQSRHAYVGWCVYPLDSEEWIYATQCLEVADICNAMFCLEELSQVLYIVQHCPPLAAIHCVSP